LVDQPKALTRAFGISDARHAWRVGLAARTGFYLVLVYLALRIALLGGTGERGANALGAMETVAAEPLGSVAIGVAAAGFLIFGILRIGAAWVDRTGSTWRRVSNALQGLFYLALTWIPVSYLLGSASAGTDAEQRQDATALLALPEGRLWTGLAGGVFLLACAWQVRTAVTHGFEEGLRMEKARPWLRRAVHIGGPVGIIGRALAFAPIGVGFLYAAITNDAGGVTGTDGELLALLGRWWGRALAALVIAGLLLFALFSLVETIYRDPRAS
jgi:hypothetical protein